MQMNAILACHLYLYVRAYVRSHGHIAGSHVERIQNPHLYKSYMVTKQKMDTDTGGNSERYLLHGTVGKNISHINAFGFDVPFCGANGESVKKGSGSPEFCFEAMFLRLWLFGWPVSYVTLRF